MAFDDLPYPHAATHAPGQADALIGYVDTSTIQTGITGNKTWQGAQIWNGSTQFNGATNFAAGGVRFTPPTAVTTATTLTVTSPYMQHYNTSGGSFTVTLPNTTAPGFVFTIVKIDSSTNPLVIAPGTSIAGWPGSVQLFRQFDTIVVESTPTSGVWNIIGGSFNPVRPAPEILMTSGTPQAGDTISGTTLETAFATQILVRANTVAPKAMIKGEGFGTYQTTTAATQQPQIRMGPAATTATSRTLITNGGALSTLLASQANALYAFNFTIQYRSIGTSALIACIAQLTFVSMSSGQSVTFLASGAPAVFSTATINSTVDNYITLTMDPSSAVAGNNNTLQMLQGTQYMPSAAA